MFSRFERFGQVVLGVMASGNVTFMAIANHITVKAGWLQSSGPEDIPAVSLLKLELSGVACRLPEKGILNDRGRYGASWFESASRPSRA